MNSQARNGKAVSTFRRGRDTVASLATGSWSAINAVAPSQVYPAGTELFQQDSPVKDVYLIDSGLVKLVHLEPYGGEMIVGLRAPGWVVAAAAILKEAHLVAAVTLTKCSLRRIPSDVFRRLLNTDAETSWRVHQMHSQEVYDQTDHVAQLGCLPARRRLEQLLWGLLSAQEMPRSQHEVKIELPLKRQEVAQLIAVTPEHLSRMLKELERDGTLHRRNGWIVIPDPQKLRHSG